MSDRNLHVFVPGRTEIAGNHTDHEGGHVIAAAIDRGIEAEAWPAGESGDGAVVRVDSEGFPTVVVELAATGADDAQRDPFAPHPDENGTTAALVRGVLSGFRQAGVDVGGFSAKLTSTLPAGGGLSSSAAFELLIAQIANELFAGGRLGEVELARIAQRAEAEFFGKPCGLMDQLAIACGGVSLFDFADSEQPGIVRIDCDFDAMGLAVVLVDVGCDHSRYTDEYALVPAEMQEVARMCGAGRLVDVAEADVVARASDIRGDLGDRAYLRALHFYREERLTAARAEALKAGDTARFCQLTRASGASSAMFLQNVSAPGRDQPAMVALAYAEMLLDELAPAGAGLAESAGRCGAARIHGGGFGGSIQAFVPIDVADAFADGMDALLGGGSSLRVRV